MANGRAAARDRTGGRVARLAFAGIPLGVAGCAGPYSTLDPVGPAAASIAALWWGMFVVSVLVLAGVTALWLYAIKRDPGDVGADAAQRVQNRWVIGGGIALPAVCITALLAFGIPVGHSLLPAGDEPALRIEIIGHQWWWEVHYPDAGITLVDEVHIPVGQSVDFHITSDDVIHSFWVPRLGGKLDAIPGRVNVLRLQTDAPGEYRGQCAEFCGLLHARMGFTLEAHAPEDFDTWLAAQADDDD